MKRIFKSKNKILKSNPTIYEINSASFRAIIKDPITIPPFSSKTLMFSETIGFDRQDGISAFNFQNTIGIYNIPYEGVWEFYLDINFETSGPLKGGSGLCFKIISGNSFRDLSTGPLIKSKAKEKDTFNTNLFGILYCEAKDKIQIIVVNDIVSKIIIKEGSSCFMGNFKAFA